MVLQSNAGINLIILHQIEMIEENDKIVDKYVMKLVMCKII